MEKLNPKILLTEYIDGEIDKCKSFPDDYSAGALDVYVKLKVRSEILNNYFDELIVKYPNDAELGKAFRKFMRNV